MTSDVSTWTNGSQTFSKGQTVTLTKEGTALTTFTTTKDTTFTYQTKEDGSNKVTATSGHIKDLTIHANTEVNYPLMGNIMDEKATLDGSGATYSQTYPQGDKTVYAVLAATAEGNTGTLTYQWGYDGYQYTCTDGTKISAIVQDASPLNIIGPSGGVVNLCGVSDDGYTRTLKIQGGTTVDTGQAKITINGTSTIIVGRDITTGEGATSIGSGTYGDIKKSDFGTGTLKFAAGASLNVNELEADRLEVTNFTANKLTVNTLVVKGSGTVNVTDTLTAGNIQLYASQLTAGTIITSGDIGRDFLDDRITVTTGNLTARNVRGNKITVEKGSVIASGDVRASDSVTVTNGDLAANNVTVNNHNITAASINATGNVTASNGDVKVTKNLAANNVTAKTITADSITAKGRVSATENINVTNTLSVAKSLNAPEITAATVILHQGATATGNITTDTLQVDPATGAAALANVTSVTAKTEGGKVNITNEKGFRIRDTATLAAIAKAAGLDEDSYTSHVSENWRKAVEERLNETGQDVKEEVEEEGTQSTTLNDDDANALLYEQTYTTKGTAEGSAAVTKKGLVQINGNDFTLTLNGVTYTFKLTSDTKNGSGYFLTLIDKEKTTIDASDVELKADSILTLDEGDTVKLLTKKNGTLTYTDNAGKSQRSIVYTNDDNTASVTTTGTLSSDGKSLFLTIGGVTYTFTLTPATKGGDIFLKTPKTGVMTIDAKDVTLNTDALVGKVLSLNKGDTVYLLKDEGGTLTYTDADGAIKLDHTYTNSDKTATVHTTGKVETSGNNLVLSVDDVKYNFDLATTTARDYTFLTSENTGETKINADDVTINDEALKGSVLSLSKGDTVYLLKNDTTGTLAYTGNDNDQRTYTYNNTAGDASIVTNTTIKADGNDLVLNVDGVTYTYTLTTATKGGDTFITSPNADDTRIDSADVQLVTDALKDNVLSLNKGDKVYLLKKDKGTLTYTGTNELAHTYENADKTASIATTATVGTDGKSLVLHVDDVKYTFQFSSTTATGSGPFLTIPTTSETKIDAADVELKTDDILSLQKDDSITLLTKDNGALTVTGNTNLPYVYTHDARDAGSATITTMGTLAKSSDGKSLLWNVNGVKYAFTLAPTVANGNTFLELSYAGDTKIDKGDVTVGTSGLLQNLKAGEKVYLLKKTNGSLIATDITDTVNLPGIYGTITGNVQTEGNNLILAVTDAESLTDHAGDSYKYIIVVKDDTKNTENKVTVEAGGNANKSAIAALAKDEMDTTELKDNTLAVQGKVEGRAVGANSVAGDVTANNVTIDAGATVNGFVAGGVTADGAANNNIVTINGGTITGDVYGGYSQGKEAKDNTVKLAGGTINGTVYGGYVGGTSAATTTTTAARVAGLRRAPAATSSTSGNALDITKLTTAGNVANFSTYNFTLPAGTTNGATMLHLTDNADTDMRNTKVNVYADGALNLYNNESVYLIKKDGGELLDDGMTKNVDATVKVGVIATIDDATVAKQDNDLVLNISGAERPQPSNSGGGSSSSGGSGSSSNANSNNSNTNDSGNTNNAGDSGNTNNSGSSSTPSVTINPNTKSAVETRAAQSNVLNMGSDFLVNTTMGQIASLAYGEDGFAAFGGSSGTGRMRYETGSYVDVNGSAFNAGIAKKTANKAGTFTWGPFFETGHGDYDSYLDNGTHGDGSTSYTGGGLFARQAFHSGCYVEGSLRLGKTKADYASEGLGTSYSTDSPYFGAHLGVGRVLPVYKGSLDVYGRYLYSRTGSDSTRLATGETYDFDAVDSHRLMFGARYTREATKKGQWYAGAALLYEFGGEARAHFQGYSLASPSSEGASVMLEGGWKYTPSETSPVNFDLGATGYLGTQRGLTFHAGVNYAF